MYRENEIPAHNAGARLIKAIRQMGFRNKCLIFTSNKENAEGITRSELNSREQQSVLVSTQTKDLQNFVNFDKQLMQAQQQICQSCQIA
jgi:hypothetical protein